MEEKWSSLDLEEMINKYVSKTRIFRNREVLRHSYTPPYLPHREVQIEELVRVLAPALRGETPSNVLVYGKTGTGKTVTVKFVTDELKRIADKKGLPMNVIYINCELVDTEYRVLARLVNSFYYETGFRVPMVGWPTDEVYSKLVEILDSKRRFVIIVLDEVDRLVKKSGDTILYSLSRINYELQHARVGVVGISNDLRFKDYLDARVLSSLGEEEIVFPPYDANQLADILTGRAKEAFYEGVLEPGVIPLCAALAAREHGDARRALDLLRVAGEIAEKEHSAKVTERHVRLAQERIEFDTIAEAILTLPIHSKLILHAVVILDEHDRLPANTGEVYAVYKDLCDYFSLDPLTQRRVSDLINELDTMGILNARVVSKGRYGRTKEIRLSLPSSKLRRIYMADKKLRELLAFELSKERRLIDWMS